MKKLITILFLLTLASPVAAQTASYKCTINGKTVYTDFPSSPSCKEMKNGQAVSKPKPQAPLDTIPPKEDKTTSDGTEPAAPTDAANTNTTTRSVPLQVAPPPQTAN
ncbi:MAG: hypothetical protein LBE24_06505 [Methylobacillus sp.]|nr:hypothetical protein [Methylobacillus sp.]